MERPSAGYPPSSLFPIGILVQPRGRIRSLGKDCRRGALGESAKSVIANPSSAVCLLYNETMLAFRPALITADRSPLTPPLIASICEDVIAPRYFFAADLLLEWGRGIEEPYWEIFQVHALDQARTRQRRKFDSWWIS